MKKRIQLILLIFFIVAGIRLFLIYRGRNAPAPAPKAAPANPNLSADDYVVPTQVHAYDLKSAKEAVDGKTVWVKSGYQVYYYPYAGGRVDFNHPTGLLPPLEKLQITNLIAARAPNTKGEELAPGVRVRQEQVMAVFHGHGDAKEYAMPVGGNRGGDYTFYLNDIFYFEDPHQLYSHWAPEVWQAIEQHQAKPGMNELQAAFALGIGIPQGSGDYGNRTLQFDNNGHPVKVTFAHNHATDVQNVPGS
jgi:hypothetical protein